jgi:hypothetical protein
MNIPYRTRRALGRLGIALLILMLVALVVWLCWVVWLERYVIYSREGATLDLNLTEEGLSGEEAVPPTAGETVPIYINEGSNTINVSTELTQFAGYYADGASLAAGIDEVRAKISELTTDIPIMLDVKNISGSMYYTSEVGPHSSEVNLTAMDKLISDLAVSDRYLIARLPGLRDRNFGLNNVDCGLFLPSGIGLWMDDQGCYWLDPTSTGTMNYLMRIVTELRSLGFDEVVFTDFRFPDSTGYTYSGDKYTAISEAAELLVTSCTTNSFAVSFNGSTEFPLPEGRSRLYLSDVEASKVKSTLAELDIVDPEIHVVFLAESNDTRFDISSVLRPLDTVY